jgi:hypothetical protein
MKQGRPRSNPSASACDNFTGSQETLLLASNGELHYELSTGTFKACSHFDTIPLVPLHPVRSQSQLKPIAKEPTLKSKPKQR